MVTFITRRTPRTGSLLSFFPSVYSGLPHGEIRSSTLTRGRGRVCATALFHNLYTHSASTMAHGTSSWKSKPCAQAGSASGHQDATRRRVPLQAGQRLGGGGLHGARLAWRPGVGLTLPACFRGGNLCPVRAPQKKIQTMFILLFFLIMKFGSQKKSVRPA